MSDLNKRVRVSMIQELVEINNKKMSLRICPSTLQVFWAKYRHMIHDLETQTHSSIEAEFNNFCNGLDSLDSNGIGFNQGGTPVFRGSSNPNIGTKLQEKYLKQTFDELFEAALILLNHLNQLNFK